MIFQEMDLEPMCTKKIYLFSNRSIYTKICSNFFKLLLGAFILSWIRPVVDLFEK